MTLASRVRVWAAAAALAAFAAAAFAQEDTILFKNGKTENAKISDTTLDGFSITIDGGGVIGHKWDEIKQVKFGGAMELNRGIELLGAGKASEATALLTKLAGDGSARSVVRQEAMFHLALARQRAGESDGAIESYRGLLTAFPKGRYLRAAGANLLAALLAKGDIPGAAKALDDIEKAAKSSGASAGAEAAVLASIAGLRAQVLEAQGKHAEALTAWEKLVAASSSSTEKSSQLAARLGATRCLAKTGKVQEAESRLKELRNEDAPNSVLAGAWNGLGDIWLAAGIASRSAEQVKDAGFAYLRGVVLYVPGADEPSDERERALAGAARAFRAFAELESSGDAKKAFQERSRRCKEQLRAQFPGSRYLESE